MAGWTHRLLAGDRLLSRLFELRGWTAEAIAELGAGFDGARITLPIRDKSGQLVNVCRYTPSPKEGESKMLSLSRRPRDLFPAPETIDGGEVWIVEGEPDSIAARSLGLPAVGLPGVEFAKRLDVTRFAPFARANIVLDCDHPGRDAAAAIAAELIGSGVDARVIDLDRSREDGLDLGDLVRDAARGGPDGLVTAAAELHDHVRVVPSPVDEEAAATGALLDQIIAFARRYVVLPGDAEALALALWVLHSWAINGAHATPYLLVVSPEKRSGKTRLLEVLALLVRAPWHTNSTSEAAMFRKIERDSPTLLLDEIDAVFGSTSERTEPLRAILNSGNRRGVTVTRCVGKDHEVADFSVFCPKVLAGIDKDQRVPDTIRDRAIAIAMRRRHSGEDVARFRERKADEAAAPIRERAAVWAPAVAHRLFEAEPALPDELGDRAADAWEPLFAIADLAGGLWPARARDAAITLSGAGETDETSTGTLLLSAMRRLLTGHTGMPSADLLDAINLDDELPFGGWRDGKGLDARWLARMLKPYKIKPRTIRLGDDTLKGYRTVDLQDAWTRYLPSESHSVTASRDTEPSESRDPSHESPYRDGDVTGVTDVTANTNVAVSDGIRDEACTAADLGDPELLAMFRGSTIKHIEPLNSGVEPTRGESYEDWESRRDGMLSDRSNGHESIATDDDEALLERARRLIGGDEE